MNGNAPSEPGYQHTGGLNFYLTLRLPKDNDTIFGAFKKIGLIKEGFEHLSDLRMGQVSSSQHDSLDKPVMSLSRVLFHLNLHTSINGSLAMKPSYMVMIPNRRGSFPMLPSKFSLWVGRFYLRSF
jgi:hypothetical protein